MGNRDTTKMTPEEVGEYLAGEHFDCEDTWYSCPKAEGGTFNPNWPDPNECNCGHEQLVARIAAAIHAEREKAR